MKISIIGTGNLAWHLARVFEKNDFDVHEIYGRDLAKAANICQELYSSKPVDSLDFSDSPSRLFFLCVNDSAISEVCSKILLPKNSTLLHCSGALAIDVLSQTLEIYHDVEVNVGVFYPLMTFTKNKPIDFDSIPICIEAQNSVTEKLLMRIAGGISDSVYKIDSRKRAILHLGAVFACNFANHLWALSKEILNDEDIDFNILKPIIIETTHKALQSKHPAQVQTGPAVRHDTLTIKKHLDQLQDDPDLVDVYKVLTESIQDWHL